ncbi:MAG: CopG family transcriptional regulator [Arcobacteraceae bacterium]
MTATVRLDTTMETKLNTLAKSLHKKKSDIIRDAINYYAKSIENDKKSRISLAVEKTKKSDMMLYRDFEGTLSDSI